MDAEILFFMTARDQAEFLDLTANLCDSNSIDPNTNNIKLDVGSCHIHFTPSCLERGVLYSGSLEIRSSKFSSKVTIHDKERAKVVFRELRNWLKMHYWSRLAYLNQNKKGKLTPSRNHWLGPDAKSWKEAKSDNILKLSSTSWMVFEIGY